MPAAHLAPFEDLGLTNTLTSASRTSATGRHNSNSTGSETQVSNTGYEIRIRAQTWQSTAETTHSTEDPQDFYMGDIYACVRRPFDCFLSSHAESDEVAGPYLKHVREISKGWHHLRYLADFMTVSTAPLRCRDLPDRSQRLNRVNISVLEYGNEITSRFLDSPDKLDHFLKEVTTSTHAPDGRLLVVEDLSTCMIEKLGSAFDIEPGFFRSHIGDYVWLNTRDPQAEVPDLEAPSAKSPYFSVQYVQPRYFQTKASLDRAKAQTESWNILRRIDNDGRFKPWCDMPGSDVGLVRSKASLWVGPSQTEQGWFGILLLDPTVTEGYPLWCGYGNFHPPPSIHTDYDQISFPPYTEHGTTTVQEFLFWTFNQARSKAKVPPPAPDLLPLTFFTMICAQWLIMCEYANTRLGQIEYETELGLSKLYDQDFDHTLKTLLIWRRRMPIYHSFVTRAISRISARYNSKTDTSPFNSWEDVLINLRDILHRIQILHERADKIMAVSMAVTQREESKQAMQESHAITRVSYLAFIFVPLSFWTSFFSMTGDYPVRTYWIYAAIALPVCACAISCLVYAGKIGGWWRKVKKGRGLWKRKGATWSGGV